MDILECIRVVTYDYVKKIYYNYLEKNNIYKASREQIKQVCEEIYECEATKNKTISEIKTKVINLYKNDEIDEEEIDDILEDMIEDKDLLVNRITIEIENYQNNSKLPRT